MSNEYDNNPKAGDPGTESMTAEGMFTDRPAFKRNKPGGPTGGALKASQPSDIERVG